MKRKRPAPEYSVWTDMKRRCNDPRRHEYRYYGARGIKVCAAWMASFDRFVSDVGPRPSKQHSIERINSAGNYEPGNVRWALIVEQNRNRRNVRLLTFRGETLPVSVWAERLGINRHAICDRIEAGWSVERALTTPTGQPITFRGETMTLNEWAHRLAIPQGTLWYRIHRYGWSAERALSTPSRTIRR